MADADQENLALIYDQIAARASRLDANTARLDAKATTLLGFSLAIGTFLAAQVAPVGWKIAAFVALAGSSYFGVHAMRPRRHQDAPEPAPLWEHMRGRSMQATLAILIEAQIKVFIANQAIHERKAKSWRVSLAALTVGVALTVVALGIGSASHDGSTKPGKPTSTRSATK